MAHKCVNAIGAANVRLPEGDVAEPVALMREDSSVAMKAVFD
jgi:hypothetical protein